MTKENQPYSSWSESLNAFKDVKLPWGDNEFFMATYRRNMEFMNATQKITAETIKAVTELQTEYMKSVFNQVSEQTKQSFTATSPEEKVVRQTKVAKDSIDQAIEHAREINSIIAKSNDKMIESIQQTAKKSVDETASLAKKVKKGSKNTGA
jgi:phasin family protein